MNNNQLLDIIYELVEQVPNQFIVQLCDKLDGMDTTEDLNSIIQQFSPTDVRQNLKRLFDYLLATHSELTPSHISIAIRSALYTYKKECEKESIELVCSGPTTFSSSFRNTYQALNEMIRDAKVSLLLVTYVIYDIKELSKELLEASKRGVSIRFIVETHTNDDSRNPYDKIKHIGEDLLKRSEVFYWPDDKRPRIQKGEFGVIHAKCAVADKKVAFVTSANLTGRALDHNIEVGTLIIGGVVPNQINKHFDELIQINLLAQFNTEK